MHNLDWDDLTSLTFGVAIFAALVGSYALGLYIRRFLPSRHQTREGVEVVHVIIGMLVAMVSVLLGLQLDAATKSFDKIGQLIDGYSIEIVQLDTILRDYGPASETPRRELRDFATASMRSMEQGNERNHEAEGRMLRSVRVDILEMAPANTTQSRVQSDALSLMNTLFEQRWELIASARLSPNLALYGVLVFWFVLIYVAFGLNGTFNIPVFAVLTLSAVAVGGSIFVLADMNTPFNGLINVSLGAMHEAVARIGQ